MMKKLVRYSVRSIVIEIWEKQKRDSRDLEIEEAATGTALIEKVEDFQPQIVFADIRMPGMTGLDAIERCVSVYPHVKWVILSGYSEFDYARKALSLRVLAYMLKPVDPEELESVLNKAVAELRENRIVLNSVFEKKMNSILNNLSSPEFDAYFSDEVWFSGFIMEFGCSSGDEESELRCKIVSALGERWANGYQVFSAAVVVLDDGRSAAVFRSSTSGIGLDTEMEFVSFFSSEIRCRPGKEYRNVQTLLDELSRIPRFEKEPEKEEKPFSDEEFPLLVRRALEYGKEKFQLAVGVAQAADYLGISPNYLSSVFRSARNETFTSFITGLRLEKSRELLKTPGITVKEVSLSLGYQSGRHFARLFRETYGCSPKEYMENLR